MAAHPDHDCVAAWARGKRLALAAHSCAETYSVLTRLPGDSRLAAEDAADLIDRRFPSVVSLPHHLEGRIHQVLAELSVTGGAVYDALVALAAVENSVPLATRDRRALPTYQSVGAKIALVPDSGSA
jgi:predicted nucleic acid-binding protein